MGDRGRIYAIILALTKGIHALSIDLETYEDVIVPPHPPGDTKFDLPRYQGATPLITMFRAHSITLAHFGLH